MNYTVGQTDWIRGHVADIFSSYVTAAALSASYEMGLLDRLATDGEASSNGSTGNGDAGDQFDPVVVGAIYRALHCAGIVQIKDESTVIPGPRFMDAYAARGYFYWLVRGCGEIMSEAGRVAKITNRSGRFYRRDMKAVAVGSCLISETEVEPLFDAILPGLKVRKLVDLGCGSGQRIIRAASLHQAEQCLGIDISEDAIRLGSNSADKLGLADRVSFLLADARDLTACAGIADADVVCCVSMGHDFWPYDECVGTLGQLRAVFPSIRRLLLCDVVRSETEASADPAIFTLGFEFVHALMGVYIPTLREWEKAFSNSGWICEKVHRVAAPPNGYLFELIPEG